MSVVRLTEDRQTYSDRINGPLEALMGYPPPDALFTRQDVGRLAGVPDDALSFWMKQGLIRRSDDGGGRGQHRKFTFLQVEVAALLKELRSYGVNVVALRIFAETLHTAIELGERHGLSGLDLEAAAEIADAMAAYDAGDLADVYSYQTNVAIDMNDRDIVHDAIVDWWRKSFEASEAEILKAAAAIGPGMCRSAWIYRDLTSVDHFANPETGPAGIWQLAFNERGQWSIESGDGHTAAPDRVAPQANAFLTLRLSKIIRELWGRL